MKLFNKCSSGNLLYYDYVFTVKPKVSSALGAD